MANTSLLSNNALNILKDEEEIKGNTVVTLDSGRVVEMPAAAPSGAAGAGL